MFFKIENVTLSSGSTTTSDIASFGMDIKILDHCTANSDISISGTNLSSYALLPGLADFFLNGTHLGKVLVDCSPVWARLGN